MFPRLFSHLAWMARSGLRAEKLRVGLIAVLCASSACSTNNVLNLRPDVDVGTTAALPAMQALVPDDPYLQQADAAQQQAGEPPPASDPAAMPPDDADGTAAGLAADPLQPAQVAGLAQVSQPQAPPMSQPVDGQPAVVMAGYPRFDPAPPASPPQMSRPQVMPADEAACRRELKRIGVVYREMAPIADSASCRIDHPISVTGLPDGVRMEPAATLNCEMALTFAKWVDNELNPAARRRYWSRVKTIHQMSSYSCRRINRSHSMSEHATGNALDVGRIELASGRDIDVEKPGLFAFRTRGFLNTVRSDGCEYFSTVLGPGYNYDHRNHFHFDIKPRRRRACH